MDYLRDILKQANQRILCRHMQGRFGESPAFCVNSCWCADVKDAVRHQHHPNFIDCTDIILLLFACNDAQHIR